MGPTEKRVCLVQMHGPRETPNGMSHLGGAGFPVTPRLPRQGLAPTPAAGRACGMGGRAQPQARTVTDAATRGDPGPPLGPSLQSELLAAAVSRALVPCGPPVGRRRRCVDGAEAAGGRAGCSAPARPAPGSAPHPPGCVGESGSRRGSVQRTSRIVPQRPAGFLTGKESHQPPRTSACGRQLVPTGGGGGLASPPPGAREASSCPEASSGLTHG